MIAKVVHCLIVNRSQEKDHPKWNTLPIVVVAHYRYQCEAQHLNVHNVHCFRYHHHRSHRWNASVVVVLDDNRTSRLVIVAVLAVILSTLDELSPYQSVWGCKTNLLFDNLSWIGSLLEFDSIFPISELVCVCVSEGLRSCFFPPARKNSLNHTHTVVLVFLTRTNKTSKECSIVDKCCHLVGK